jgi:hypothetical protein
MGPIGTTSLIRPLPRNLATFGVPSVTRPCFFWAWYQSWARASLGLRACAFALSSEPFRALFWALNFGSCVRPPVLSRSYFRALNFLLRHWFPFGLLFSFRSSGFLSPTCVYIYTLTHIHTPPHTYLHTRYTPTHTYVQYCTYTPHT